MPRYKVTLTDEEQKELKKLIQKGGKGYRIRQRLLKKLNNYGYIKRNSFYVAFFS